MNSIKNYFSGEWYKKKSFFAAVLIVVLIAAICCIAVFGNKGGASSNSVSSELTLQEFETVKDHYGIYNESTSNLYTCRDKNDNKLTGFRMVVRADMKKPMTKEELYNDAIVIDRNSGAVETEIHFVYQLDNSYNATITLCKGEIFKVTLEGRKFITKEQWIAGFESEAA